MMSFRDLRSTTWYLNKVKLRTCDHFPVVVNIEEKDPRAQKKKGWAGRIPRSEDEKNQHHRTRALLG